MGNIPTTTIRIDPNVKERANEVFDSLGLSLSAAVNMFLRAVIRTQGIPFDVCLEAASEKVDDDVQ